MGLLALATLTGSVGGQRPKHARKLAASLADQGLPPNGELSGALGDRVAVAFNYLSAAALLAIVVLVVVKPG